MKIALASDHAGYELKEYLKIYLNNSGYEIVDFGTTTAESCDYPIFAVDAAKAVADGSCVYGVIICGTGIGMSIATNKIKGIRAANCLTEEMARLTREHNNANVLNLGARLMDKDTAVHILDKFLNTDFTGGRHESRVSLIHQLTGL
jgi:ribose 5-phosphate isomerase B